MRLGLFGSAAPRVARALAPAPQITQRDLPPVMPPAWLVERAQAQGFDPMLALKAMQEEPANAPIAASVPVPPMGLMMKGSKGAAKTAIGAPAAPVQPQIKGGMALAAQDASKPRGAFMQGPKPPSAAPSKPDDGGMWRAVGYRPEETGQDFFSWLTSSKAEVRGARDERSAAIAAEQAKAANARQRAEVVQLFGPQAGVAFDTNPEKFGEFVGSNYEAANVSGGESRVFGNGRETFTAPKFGVDGGFGYTQGPDGIDWQGQRGQSYGEATADGALAETGRANRADESLGRDRLGLDRSKFQFERTQPQTPEFGDENSLRSQYLGQAKTFQDLARAASSVRSLSPNMNPAEQMALIFQTMKMLDPSSTVREGEYANAQNTTGVFGQVWNVYNKAKDGKFLDEKQITDFRGMIDSLYASAEGSYAKTYDFYRGMAPRYNMDPSIIQDFRLPPSSEAVGSGAARAGQALIPEDDTDALVQKWLK